MKQISTTIAPAICCCATINEPSRGRRRPGHCVMVTFCVTSRYLPQDHCSTLLYQHVVRAALIEISADFRLVMLTPCQEGPPSISVDRPHRGPSLTAELLIRELSSAGPIGTMPPPATFRSSRSQEQPRSLRQALLVPCIWRAQADVGASRGDRNYARIRSAERSTTKTRNNKRHGWLCRAPVGRGAPQAAPTDDPYNAVSIEIRDQSAVEQATPRQQSNLGTQANG